MIDVGGSGVFIGPVDEGAVHELLIINTKTTHTNGGRLKKLPIMVLLPGNMGDKICLLLQ